MALSLGLLQSVIDFSTTPLLVVAGDTVTVSSSDFDTTNFDMFFNSMPPAIPPEDISWFFEPFLDGTCIALTPGALGVDENFVSFSVDRQSLTIRNVQVATGGGSLYRVIRLNGTTFIQIVPVAVLGN